MYVCGSPLRHDALGHAFTYIVFDTLARYFQFKGWPVRYAQNVTTSTTTSCAGPPGGRGLEGAGRPLTRRFIEDWTPSSGLRPTYYRGLPRRSRALSR